MAVSKMEFYLSKNILKCKVKFRVGALPKRGLG
jgi:hypothetical protein